MMDNQLKPIFCRFSKELEQQSSCPVQPINPKSRQQLQQLSQLLRVDGLLVHSTVRSVLDMYHRVYDGYGMVPEMCEVELALAESKVRSQGIEQQCAGLERRIEVERVLGDRLGEFIKEAEQILAQIKDESAKERAVLGKFESEKASFVRGQNKKLEQMMEEEGAVSVQDTTGITGMEGADHEQQIAAVKQRIDEMTKQYCGSHPFPESKAEALQLMNTLDSEIQTLQLKLLQSNST